MNSDPADRELQRLFEESRAGDARRAPAFGQVVSGSHIGRRAVVRWRRLAAAAAAIVLLGASLALFHRRAAPEPLAGEKQWAAVPAQGAAAEPAVDLKQWAAVSAWRATTDWLLTGATSSWESGLATPTDSLIHSVSGETEAVSDNGKEAL